MSSLVTTAQHPVLQCLNAINAALDEVATVDPVWMSTDDKETALQQGVQVADLRSEQQTADADDRLAASYPFLTMLSVAVCGNLPCQPLGA